MNNISEEEIRNLELDEKKNPEFVSEISEIEYQEWLEWHISRTFSIECPLQNAQNQTLPFLLEFERGGHHY